MQRKRTLWRAFLMVACAAIVLAGSGSAWARSGGSMGGGFRSRSMPSFSRSAPVPSFRPSYAPSFAPTPRYIPIPVPVGGGYGGGYGYGRSYGYSPGSSWGGVVFFLIILVIVGAVILVSVLKKRKQQAVADKANQVDVFRIELGVQAQARSIQERFERMAENAETDSEAGLASLLREVALSLRRQVQAIEYGAVTRVGALAFGTAQQQFGQWAGDARAKYNREIVRADAMGLRKEQKEAATRDELHDEDGEFAVAEFFVVTLVLGLRGVVLGTSVNDARELEALLEQLSRITAEQMVAVEVIWSPASLSDSMARSDMQLRYPELFAI